MKFEEFNTEWSKAFGSRLTERSGASAWSDFVEDQRTSDGLLMKVLGEFAVDYNAACKDMSPHAKNCIPTYRAFRDRYFEYIAARNPAPPSNCPTCGGRGIVYALAPCKGDGDRQLAPEDWRTVTPERVYPFAEAYNCPRCRASAKIYDGKDFLRDRVMRNCVPEVMAADDPRNHFGVPLTGDGFIRLAIRERCNTANLAGNGTVARDAAPAASFTPDMDDDELERKFPMEEGTA